MSADPLAGTPFRTQRVLGRGGHGEVFEALHVELGRVQVVKLLHHDLADDERMLERFRLEAQTLAALSHPNIVSIQNFGHTPSGRPYLVMDHLEGRTLDQELRAHGRVSVYVALDWVSQTLDGLAAVHGAGFVHRDIKLSNLFLVREVTGPGVVKLLDFGVAKVVAPARSRVAPLAHPTEEGVIIGTPKFLSPEQAFGQPVDHRADIYAAGLVLYQLLAGRGPFDDIRREVTLVAAHARLEPPPPSHFSDEPIPPELDRAVLKALAKRREERFQSAHEFAAALRQVSGLLRGSGGLLDTSTFDPEVFRKAKPQDLAPMRAASDATDEDVPPTAPDEPEPRSPDATVELSKRTVEAPPPGSTRTEITTVMRGEAGPELRAAEIDAGRPRRDWSLVLIVAGSAALVATLVLLIYAAFFPS